MLKRVLLGLLLVSLAWAAGCSLPVTPAPFEIVQSESAFAPANGTSLSSVVEGYLAMPDAGESETAVTYNVSDLLRTSALLASQTAASNVRVSLTYTLPGEAPLIATATSDDAGHFALPVHADLTDLEGTTMKLEFTEESQTTALGAESLEQTFLRGSGITPKRPGLLTTTQRLLDAAGADRVSGVRSMSVVLSYRNSSRLPVTFDLWLSTTPDLGLDDLFVSAEPTPLNPLLTGTPVTADDTKNLYQLCTIPDLGPITAGQPEIAWESILNQAAAQAMLNPNVDTERGVDKQVTAYLTVRPAAADVYVSHVRIFLNVNASVVSSAADQSRSESQTVIDLF